MFCRFCGATLSDDAVFCRVCGHSMTEGQQNAQQEQQQMPPQQMQQTQQMQAPYQQPQMQAPYQQPKMQQQMPYQQTVPQQMQQAPYQQPQMPYGYGVVPAKPHFSPVLLVLIILTSLMTLFIIGYFIYDKMTESLDSAQVSTYPDYEEEDEEEEDAYADEDEEDLKESASAEDEMPATEEAVLEESPAEEESIQESGDWISKHNVKISRASEEFMLTAASRDGDQDLEDVDIPCVVYLGETTEGVKDGFKKVSATYVRDISRKSKDVGAHFYEDVFDRYTGLSFGAMTVRESSYEDGINKEITTEPFLLKTDQGTFEISLEKETSISQTDWIITCTIICPVDYDGVVFVTGYDSLKLSDDYIARLGELADQNDFDWTIDKFPYFDNGHPYFYFTPSGH